jgi:hypothetical protein
MVGCELVVGRGSVWLGGVKHMRTNRGGRL